METMLQGQDLHYKTGFHGKPLIIAWLPLVNFAVLMASIKWCKYTFYCHAILGFGVIALTLFSTIHILVDDWLSPNQNFKIQKIHNIAGLAVTIWVVLQLVTGILARVIQLNSKIRTNTCVLIKRIHSISSYAIMLVAKFNYLNIKVMKGKYLQFFEYFTLEIIFVIIYLWIKSSYWTLSQEIIDGQSITKNNEQNTNKVVYFLLWLKQRIISLKNEILQKSFNPPIISRQLLILKSQNQIQIHNYITFNDVVYDISNLRLYHPGGQNIINLMNKRQVNRFLYGYYKPENDHKLTIHKHTKQSLRLCGQPIAKIQRIISIQGLNDLTKLKIISSKPITLNSKLNTIYLQPIAYQISNKTMKFIGYQKQNQIGQHLSLTICDKRGRKRCTRLYTTIWCMRTQNLQFITKFIPQLKLFTTIKPKQYKLKDEEFCLNQSLIDTQTNYSDCQSTNCSIPLVIKKYQNGSFTSRFLVQDFKGQIIISKPMGMGMKYQELKYQGKVIIVCGGTGILPFCDLIDLLFKRVKHLQNSDIQDEIILADPLIKQDLIKSRQFILYYAVQSNTDIIPTTLYQLDYLCGSQNIKFDVNLKIKKDADIIKNNFKRFKYQTSGFNDQIKDHLKQLQSLNKIYICGPYKMNEDMTRIFKENNLLENLYNFM